MLKHYFFMFLLLAGVTVHAQVDTIDFESFNPPVDSFLNGSDLSGGFTVGDVFLPNDFNTDFSSWSQWAISTKGDTVTEGFMNQYSSITGGGRNGSNTFAVAFKFSPIRLILNGDKKGGTVEGMYVTNGTYPYLSMLNGDSFAKKFGGATGDDPDFFLLVVKKYLDGVLSTDSVNFYLADYRFTDNSEDFIIDEWTFVDLTSLGAADSLEFNFYSSDTGINGINTPQYFLMDDLIVRDNAVTSIASDRVLSFDFLPTRVSDVAKINWAGNGQAIAQILDVNGKMWARREISNGETNWNLSDLPAGLYIIQLSDGQKAGARRFLKN